jgi:hypothetical protein
MEADAVVANPQPKLGWFDVLKTLDVTLAGFQIAGERVEDAESGVLIDGAQLSFGLVVPDNVLAYAYRGLVGSSGVRPMRAKSSGVRPNSARTFS